MIGFAGGGGGALYGFSGVAGFGGDGGSSGLRGIVPPKLMPATIATLDALPRWDPQSSKVTTVV